MDKKYLVTVTPVQDNPAIKNKNSLSATDRKNIKVSPETLNKIKAICTMKDMKNYELIDEMLDYYIANKLNSNDQDNLNDIMSIRK
ncbi:BfmA/BtgA family mobilization protein [Bacillus cereus group sp. BfR-BA-01523]|uniref:BfmA/BtgA family mobilization protein n=1 Tax=Bacillus cereus group sp. BfR-BA-01523 TaxID=2920371 RepID=UPI001F5784E4|nr:BfmA/BtgA family mobilization protein [Bacillus cereus group sp. BfR-BA-01523]